MKNSLYTCFASAERSSQEEIMQQHRIIANNEELIVFLNGVASLITVLNMNRQIVFVNKTILSMLGLSDIHHVLGHRIGEMLGCRYAFTINGCGTSNHCKACGMVLSELASVQEKSSIEECSITNDNTQVTFDFRVHSTNINMYGENFILCSLFDIGSEKRRGVMERLFFHDLMNTVNGINGITQVLDKIGAEEHQVYLSYLTLLLNSLGDQINSHRVLTMAEKDEYKTEKHELSSLDFVTEEVDKYSQLAIMEGKEILISEYSENHKFVSDKVLLSRVLGNMIKNALEAEKSGAMIEVGVHKDGDDDLHFRVHNSCVMSENDKLQVFRRSFSTKGSNRGLGTYSMKLLTEKYLNGTISFCSKPDEGTSFVIKIPV